MPSFKADCNTQWAQVPIKSANRAKLAPPSWGSWMWYPLAGAAGWGYPWLGFRLVFSIWLSSQLLQCLWCFAIAKLAFPDWDVSIRKLRVTVKVIARAPRRQKLKAQKRALRHGFRGGRLWPHSSGVIFAFGFFRDGCEALRARLGDGGPI